MSVRVCVKQNDDITNCIVHAGAKLHIYTTFNHNWCEYQYLDVEYQYLDVEYVFIIRINRLLN